MTRAPRRPIPPPLDGVDSILVLRSGAVGDCLVSTPALGALRRGYPDARITLLGDPFSSEVFEHSTDIDELISINAREASTLRYGLEMLRLRSRRFPLLIDMHGVGRSFVQTLLIGGRRRIGFDIRESHRRAYTDLAPYRLDVHTVLRQAEILKPLGLAIDESERSLRLTLTQEERSAATELLQDVGIEPCAKFAVIQVTAGMGRSFKQWLPERFARIAEWLQREYALPVVLTGHLSDDKEMISGFLDSVREPVTSLVGRTSLRLLSAVLERAQVYVGCDTGTMHLAAAVNTPIVALFGHSFPHRWHPWTRAPYQIVRAGVECSPCEGKTCAHEFRCMTEITVDRVEAAVHQVLQSAAVALPG